MSASVRWRDPVSTTHIPQVPTLGRWGYTVDHDRLHQLEADCGPTAIVDGESDVRSTDERQSIFAVGRSATHQTVGVGDRWDGPVRVLAADLRNLDLRKAHPPVIARCGLQRKFESASGLHTFAVAPSTCDTVLVAPAAADDHRERSICQPSRLQVRICDGTGAGLLRW